MQHGATSLASGEARYPRAQPSTDAPTGHTPTWEAGTLSQRESVFPPLMRAPLVYAQSEEQLTTSPIGNHR